MVPSYWATRGGSATHTQEANSGSNHMLKRGSKLMNKSVFIQHPCYRSQVRVLQCLLASMSHQPDSLVLHWPFDPATTTPHSLMPCSGLCEGLDQAIQTPLQIELTHIHHTTGPIQTAMHTSALQLYYSSNTDWVLIIGTEVKALLPPPFKPPSPPHNPLTKRQQP